MAVTVCTKWTTFSLHWYWPIKGDCLWITDWGFSMAVLRGRYLQEPHPCQVPSLDPIYPLFSGFLALLFLLRMLWVTGIRDCFCSKFFAEYSQKGTYSITPCPFWMTQLPLLNSCSATRGDEGHNLAHINEWLIIPRRTVTVSHVPHIWRRMLTSSISASLPSLIWPTISGFGQAEICM